MTVRLVLADDHPLVREGVRALLESDPEFEVVGQASDGTEATVLAQRLRPDVVVLDLMMSGRGGLDVLGELSAQGSSGPRVVVLSMHQSEAYVLEAMDRGAAGYVLKQAEAGELMRAIREVAAGRRYLSPPLSERALDAYARRAGPPADPYYSLTPREREVLRLVAEGKTNAEIAADLFISRRTVETHRAHVMKKLGLRTHVDVALYALRRGVVPDEKDRPS